MTKSRTYPDREEVGLSGEKRKAHYGDGRQPWDAMLELGIGPHFAAGSILKYLRRDKDPEHSAESARWYYHQLVRLADPRESGFPHRDRQAQFEVFNEVQTSKRLLISLLAELTPEERGKLG